MKKEKPSYVAGRRVGKNTCQCGCDPPPFKVTISRLHIKSASSLAKAKIKVEKLGPDITILESE